MSSPHPRTPPQSRNFSPRIPRASLSLTSPRQALSSPPPERPAKLTIQQTLVKTVCLDLLRMLMERLEEEEEEEEEESEEDEEGIEESEEGVKVEKVWKAFLATKKVYLSTEPFIETTSLPSPSPLESLVELCNLTTFLYYIASNQPKLMLEAAVYLGKLGGEEEAVDLERRLREQAYVSASSLSPSPPNPSLYFEDNSPSLHAINRAQNLEEEWDRKEFLRVVIWFVKGEIRR